jgi:hypothetical protein
MTVVHFRSALILTRRLVPHIHYCDAQRTVAPIEGDWRRMRHNSNAPTIAAMTLTLNMRDIQNPRMWLAKGTDAASCDSATRWDVRYYDCVLAICPDNRNLRIFESVGLVKGKCGSSNLSVRVPPTFTPDI